MSGRSPEKSSRRLMQQAANRRFGNRKPRTQELIDKVIDEKTKKTREEMLRAAMNDPDATEVLTDRGFEDGKKMLKRNDGGMAEKTRVF